MVSFYSVGCCWAPSLLRVLKNHLLSQVSHSFTYHSIIVAIQTYGNIVVVCLESGLALLLTFFCCITDELCQCFGSPWWNVSQIQGKWASTGPLLIYNQGQVMLNVLTVIKLMIWRYFTAHPRGFSTGVSKLFPCLSHSTALRWVGTQSWYLGLCFFCAFTCLNIFFFCSSTYFEGNMHCDKCL